jgi:hypothetical protein
LQIDSLVNAVYRVTQVKSSQNQSHIATDGESVSLGVEPQICLTVTVFFSCGAHSEERAGVCFFYSAAHASAVFPRSESLRTRDHILLSQI